MARPKSKSNFNVYEVMPGSKIITFGDYSILVGCPLEVVKAIIGKKLPIPTHIVLPDNIYSDTIPQNSTEFPLYHFLFGYQGLAKGLQLSIVGTEVQLEHSIELLRIALLGISEKELDFLGIDKELKEQILKEEDFYQLKSQKGKSLGLSDLVTTQAFDNNGILELKDLKIIKKGNNYFEFTNGKNTELIDVNLYSKQIPPYFIPKKTYPTDNPKFGVEIVGGSSGFSPINPCSSLAISYNGFYLLVDPVPYLDYLLKSRGISKKEIMGLFITHIHDDHCVLLPFLLHSKKITIITTPEIYYMSLYKLALTLNISDYKQMEKYFNFYPIEADKEYNFYGLTIYPHYTLHPIPTIGAKFSIKEKNKTYSITYVGDNQSLSIIDGMYDKGIINSDRRNRIKNLYIDETDLLIADGGHGMIHGDPGDGTDSKADKVAFIHLDELPDEYKKYLNIANVGKIFSILSYDEKDTISKAISLLIDNLGDEIDRYWIPHILNFNKIIKFNAGDIIIKQGFEKDPKAYLIISGYCKVVKKQPSLDYITTLEAGEILGEIAIIKESEERSATVVAETPVTMCEFNMKAFRSLVIEKELLFKMSNVWYIREKFSKISPYNMFPSRTITELSQISNETIFGIEHKMRIDEKTDKIYIVLEGDAVLRRNDKEIELNPGDIFGNLNFILDNSISYDVFVYSYLHCVVVDLDKMLNFIDDTPIMNYHISTETKNFLEKL